MRLWRVYCAAGIDTNHDDVISCVIGVVLEVVDARSVTPLRDVIKNIIRVSMQTRSKLLVAFEWVYCDA